MAVLTLEEATLQLTTVNAAIEALIAGKRLTQLRVGSGSFQRLYVFSEITMENLKSHRDELLAIVSSYNSSLPTFATSRTIPLTVGKDIY